MYNTKFKSWKKVVSSDKAQKRNAGRELIVAARNFDRVTRYSSRARIRMMTSEIEA